ncbi:MAG: cytochrome b5-like heme/steroid binding domain-containing protein [Candidatus Nomurabacteria bacterium]|nr:cytochrome b5-like heme/steroid binding domain-containing protein [Candidatus Nomurabacteria bacterium]
MKNTFIIAMFIFWGFVVAVVSAGYVVKQNRLAQESMQKVYIDSLQKIADSVSKGRVTVVKPKTPDAVATTPTGNNFGTVSNLKPTPTPTPKPVTPSGPTMAMVATHNTQSDCWIIINGKVYSVASYIPMHPGGSRRIVDNCGGEATSPYDRQGHSSYADSLLGSYLVGTLQ